MVDPTVIPRYVFDNEDILLELDGANNIVARYTHGLGVDEPLILEKASASFFYHADGLGSITELTDASGAIVKSYTYSSFGKIENETNPTFFQPYTFTAREFDQETDTYFYRGRTYDWRTGRFIQTDPIPGFLSLPQTLNPYVYVVNNPINISDPSGEVVPLILAGAVVGAGVNVLMTATAALLDDKPLTASDLAAAALSGAVSGAVSALAGPLGGTIAKGLGSSATGFVAKSLTVGISGLGGASAQGLANLISCQPSSVLNAGIFGAGGDALATFFPVKGVSTLAQAAYFAPRSFSGFFRTGNARALLGAFFTSAGVGAASTFIPTQ